MPRTVARIALPMAVAALCLWFVWVPATADPADTFVDPLAGTPIRGMYIRPPQKPTDGKPLQVLLALHGMGGSGPEFAHELTEQADRNGWLLVAPTIDYGDWTNPYVVAQEDPLLIDALNNYLDALPQLIGLPTRRLVLILGHSRGAQLAHRFAEFRPDKVLAIAALSAGDYTLPEADLRFPYGIQDLDHYSGHAFDAVRFDSVAIWVGVGGLDTNAAEVPRQWDSIEGATRVQRAQAFEEAARELGANAVLRVFGNAGHGLTTEMRTAACDFLRSSVQAVESHQNSKGIDPEE